MGLFGNGSGINENFGSQAEEPRSDLNIYVGEYDKVDFSDYATISTAHLTPCIACISSDGVMSHLNPNWQSSADIREFVGWLKRNADLSTTKIALVGGVDDEGQRYIHFDSSAAMVDFLKEELSIQGFQVTFEDLYGERHRRVVLNASGHLDITDDWDEEYHRTYDFSQPSGDLANRLDC